MKGYCLNGLMEPMHHNLLLEHMERKHIIKVLGMFDCNITKSAEALGIGRNTLYRKMEKYGIECTNIERCSEVERD